MILAHAMPTYEYKCDNGHTFEAMQSMSEDPLDTCAVCGAPARRVLHPPAVHFKGSGFYTTDYARKKAGSAKSANGSDGSKPESKDSKDSKSDSGSSSSSGSGEAAAAKKD